VLLMPFANVLIAEAATVAFLHLGLGHGNRAQPANPHISRATGGNRQPETASFPPPRPLRGRNRRPVAVSPVASKAKAETDLIRLVARGERLPSQDALAQRWRVHKGTVSKWLADFEARGLVRRDWDGRHKQVAAA
jgi:hypothetical protein